MVGTFQSWHFIWQAIGVGLQLIRQFITDMISVLVGINTGKESTTSQSRYNCFFTPKLIGNNCYLSNPIIAAHDVGHTNVFRIVRHQLVNNDYRFSCANHRETGSHPFCSQLSLALTERLKGIWDWAYVQVGNALITFFLFDYLNVGSPSSSFLPWYFLT